MMQKTKDSLLNTDTEQSDIKLWLRLLSCVDSIETELRIRMREQFGSTLPRFDLLSQLERFPDGIKMGELSRRMLVTGGNITGLADGMEKEGLVERATDIQQRRTWHIKITPAGLDLFKKMAEAHQSWINEIMMHSDIEGLC